MMKMKRRKNKKQQETTSLGHNHWTIRYVSISFHATGTINDYPMKLKYCKSKERFLMISKLGTHSYKHLKRLFFFKTWTWSFFVCLFVCLPLKRKKKDWKNIQILVRKEKWFVALFWMTSLLRTASITCFSQHYDNLQQPGEMDLYI